MAPGRPIRGTLDPDDPISANRPTSIERVVYFTPPINASGTTTAFATPSATSTTTVTYYTSNRNLASLKPGRYAVVGSGNQLIGGQYVSKVGRTSTATDSNPDTADTRRVVLAPQPDATGASTDPNQLLTYFSGQGATLPEPSPLWGSGTTQDAQPVVAAAIDQAIDPAISSATTAAAVGSNTGGPGRSLAVSDPIVGYASTQALASLGGAGVMQVSGNSENEWQYNVVLDVPADSPASPLGGDGSVFGNLTNVGYRAVHLQRLANPQLPWNAVTNPYLTIDSATVDVTSLNGVWNPTTQTPAVEPGLTATGPLYKLASTQRGDQSSATPPPQLNAANLLWAHEYSHVGGSAALAKTFTFPAGDGPGTTPGGVAVVQHNFNFILHHSLGYLNQPYGAWSLGTAYVSPGNSNGKAAPTAAYAGAPTTAFPWLTWNNRPFVSPLELALVPKSRQSRLLFDYSACAGQCGGLRLGLGGGGFLPGLAGRQDAADRVVRLAGAGRH